MDWRLKQCANSVLVVDDAAASVLAWSSPAQGLAGVADLLKLTAIVGLNDANGPQSLAVRSSDKIAFVVSSLLVTGSPVLKRIEEFVLSAPHTECVVVSALSESAHRHHSQHEAKDAASTAAAAAAAAEAAAAAGTSPEQQQQQPNDVFEEVAAKVKSWLRSSQMTGAGANKKFVKAKSSVIHVPSLVAFSLATDLYLIPSARAVFPRTLQGHKSAGAGASASHQNGSCAITIDNLGYTVATALGQLATAAPADGQQQPQVVNEIFALGSVAVPVARSTVSVLNSERSSGSTPQSPLLSSQPTPQRSAIIFIDRTVDLLTPALHADSLLDRIVAVCDPMSSASSVPLFEVEPVSPPVSEGEPDVPLLTTPADNEGHDQPSVFIPAIHVTLAESKDLVQTFIDPKLKAALLSLRKSLVDAVGAEKLPYRASKMVSKITAAQLKVLEETLRNYDNVPFSVVRRNMPLIQFALAAEAALISSEASLWDELQGIEKVLLLSAGESTEDSVLLGQLRDLLPKQGQQTSANRKPNFGVRDVLTLALICYTLLGDIIPVKGEVDLMSTTLKASGGDDDRLALRATAEAVEEQELKASLTEAVMRLFSSNSDADAFSWAPPIEYLKLDPEGFRDQLAKDVDQVFWRLRAVRTTRSMFAKFIDPKLPPGTPLLRHLLQSIFHLDRPPIDGLRHVTDEDTINRLLKGFSSRFLKTASPRPDEQCASIVFVLIGGVTLSEVRELREFVQARIQFGRLCPKITLLATDLLSPMSTYEHVLS